MKSPKAQSGHSFAETRTIVHAVIDQSAERLRRRLRAAWSKQVRPLTLRKARHGVTV